ncbi:hypothetical protein PRUPE_8G046800 [Prunus persica]|uniref:Laccase n=1 Tax=Prunus persica TaxID=3760 RepID=M5W3N3_PRUPE|nr:laccase-15 [Prunus persica]ONH90328.1 hypothetical protein PRUPE_8G046800 [Prunus persica]
MLSGKRNSALQILSLLLVFLHCQASSHNYHFVVKEATYTRLCSTKEILTVNGKFPGPVLQAHKGDTIYVNVHNNGRYNITIHWHGVKQPRYPWSDGPEYITQCPIQPGHKFKQNIIFSEEEGTIWWHAHSDWSRATVYGAIIVYPKRGASYPFPQPHEEVPIILGQWWKRDIMEVFEEFVQTGGEPNVSDAHTINGQPGDLYPCSKSETFKLFVDENKAYLLRIINAAMNSILFFSIANHNLTVVGADGSYTKPVTRDYITISPGQTLDALLLTNQQVGQYYMAARAYSSSPAVAFDNTTTTAIVQYNNRNSTPFSSPPILPYLPYYNDTNAAFNFFDSLRSLANEDHPIDVPKNITTRLISTVSVNTFPCPNSSCEGPNGTRLAASMNNISFVDPTTIDILEAYYYHINGVFREGFPDFPPLVYNFTGEDLPLILQTPKRGTKVKVFDYGSIVECVFQGTNLVAGIDHPMHLHGFSFYIVGRGFGNFDQDKDPLNYNLVDPPHRNTVIVPINGWTAIRFKTNNPGVWFLHCHLERHLTWGMNTVFIVKNGKHKKEKLLPAPQEMPPC